MSKNINGSKVVAALKGMELGHGIPASGLETAARCLDQAAKADPAMSAAVLIGIVRLWRGSSVIKFLSKELIDAAGRATWSDLFAEVLIIAEAFRREALKFRTKVQTHFKRLEGFGVDFKELGITATACQSAKLSGAPIPLELDVSAVSERKWLEIMLPLLLETTYEDGGPAGGAFVIQKVGSVERIVSDARSRKIRLDLDRNNVVARRTPDGAVVIGLAADDQDSTIFRFATVLFPEFRQELVPVLTGGSKGVLQTWLADQQTAVNAPTPKSSQVAAVKVPAIPELPPELLQIDAVSRAHQTACSLRQMMQSAIAAISKRQAAEADVEVVSQQIAAKQAEIDGLARRLSELQEEVRQLTQQRSDIVVQSGNPDSLMSLADIDGMQRNLSAACQRLNQLVTAFSALSNASKA